MGRDHRLTAYLRPHELHTAFNFNHLVCPWLPAALRASIDRTLSSHDAVGAPPAWVLGNHDVCRPVSRFARPQELTTSSDRFLSHFDGRMVDFAVGLRRARAAALLSLALPGGAYIYQGEELGLPEVEDIAWDKVQDPMVAGTNRTNRGRDGCRVPLPWTRGGESYGISPDGPDEPWLPQPAVWGDLSAEGQEGDAASTLELYRAALRVRRTHPALGDGTLEWIDAGPDVVAFRREPGSECWINLGADPVPMPQGQVLVASAEAHAGTIPTDVAVWLQIGRFPRRHTAYSTSHWLQAV